jgi:hypothetical protein
MAEATRAEVLESFDGEIRAAHDAIDAALVAVTPESGANTRRLVAAAYERLADLYDRVFTAMTVARGSGVFTQVLLDARRGAQAGARTWSELADHRAAQSGDAG